MTISMLFTKVNVNEKMRGAPRVNTGAAAPSATSAPRTGTSRNLVKLAAFETAVTWWHVKVKRRDARLNDTVYLTLPGEG